ncbi:MAG TPA: long-chain fatty acid--CoA ligase [Rhodothermales bacterium]
MSNRIFRSPEGDGSRYLGRSIPDLLYAACDRYPNDEAFLQRTGDGWRAFSLQEFREIAEEAAWGLKALGLERGDRVALFMASDVYFCLVDMACLIGGFVDVPIYLTHGDESISYVLRHSGARAVVVSQSADVGRLAGLAPESLEFVVHVSDEEPDAPGLAPPIKRIAFGELRESGRSWLRANPRARDGQAVARAGDLATIIYTSGTTGRPKGVMLSHQNITYNALAAFDGLRDYRPGAGGETVLSFLPLTHVFARTLQYGYMAHGTTTYFTDPDQLSEDLKRVRPTIFATVPRVLEKVYTRIRERAALETGIRKKLLLWSLDLAHRYRVGERPKGWYRAQLALADRLVFSKWRAALGGRVKYVISGGAALNPELSGLFAAAGVTVLQGYGLTESSPIIAYNRPENNRPETVGTLLPGVEVRIEDDGEILTRGPHVMQGYYQDPERTNEAIDDEGWLHTGDVGEMTEDGFLKLTDRKKDLFKLSTGKYVMPQPLESRLTTEPLVEQVVVIGSGYSYCTALIFPDQEVLRTFAKSRGIDPRMPIDELVKHPRVVARYEQLVDKANRGLDPWSTIKRFVLIPEHLSIESGLLTPTMKVRRSQVHERYAPVIEALYGSEADRPEAAGHATDTPEAIYVP